MITSGKGRQRIACMLLVFMMVVSLWGGIRPAQAASTTDITAGSQQYYITSVMYSGRAINMYVDSMSDIKNKTTVNLYALDKSQTQRFTFTKNSKGNYLMIPAGSKYTVNVSALSAGTAVFAWENKAANNEYFIIEKTSDGYYTLRMENSTGLYLTATSNSKLTLKAKASDNSQKFAFHAYPETSKTPETTSAPTSETQKAPETTKTEETPTTSAVVDQIFGVKIEYYFTSVKYNGYAINMSVNKNSSIKNNTKVNLYKLDKSETQRFTFTKNDKGQYLMIPLKTSYTVNVTKLSSGCKVIAYKNAAKNNEYLIVEMNSDNICTFRLANKPSLYLTATSNSTLTFKPKSSDIKSQQFKCVNHTVETAKNTVIKIVKNAVTGKTDNGSTETGTTNTTTGTNKSVTLGVKYLSQLDKRWKNISYDPKDKNATVGGYGCLLTCMTMVYNYRHNTTFTPVTYGKKRMKFDGQGYANGGDYKKLTKVKKWPVTDMVTIRYYLDKGIPAIIYGHSGKDPHYAVIYGYVKGGTNAAHFKVYDPSSKKRTTLRLFLNTFKKNNSLWILYA